MFQSRKCSTELFYRPVPILEADLLSLEEGSVIQCIKKDTGNILHFRIVQVLDRGIYLAEFGHRGKVYKVHAKEIYWVAENTVKYGPIPISEMGPLERLCEGDVVHVKTHDGHHLHLLVTETKPMPPLYRGKIIGGSLESRAKYLPGETVGFMYPGSTVQAIVSRRMDGILWAS